MSEHTLTTGQKFVRFVAVGGVLRFLVSYPDVIRIAAIPFAFIHNAMQYVASMANDKPISRIICTRDQLYESCFPG